jgi:hypothetical protein
MNQGHRAVETAHEKNFNKKAKRKSVLDSQHNMLLYNTCTNLLLVSYIFFHLARRMGMQRKGGRSFCKCLGQRRSDLYLSNNARSFWDGLACSGMMAAVLNVWEAYCSEENACIGVCLALF